MMDILTYFKKIGVEGTTSISKKIPDYHFSVDCLMFGDMVYAPFPKFYSFRELTGDVSFYTTITSKIDGVWNIPLVRTPEQVETKKASIDVFVNNNTHVLTNDRVQEFIGAFKDVKTNAYQTHENMFGPVLTIDKYLTGAETDIRILDKERSLVQLYCVSPDDMKHFNTTFMSIASSVANDAIVYVAFDDNYVDSVFVKGLAELYDIERVTGIVRSIKLKSGLTLEMTDRKMEIFEAAKSGLQEWTTIEETYSE